jgi:hypothetical protein
MHGIEGATAVDVQLRQASRGRWERDNCREQDGYTKKPAHPLKIGSTAKAPLLRPNGVKP